MAHGGRGHPKYKDEFCEKVVTHMADGLSFDSFGGEIGVSRQTLYRWIERYPEFADAKSQGDMKCLLWWEKIGRSGLVGKLKPFNAVVWVFSMKARFGRIGWRDIPEDLTGRAIQSGSQEVSQKLESLKAMLRDEACQQTKPSTQVSLPLASQPDLLGVSSKPE